MKTLGIAIPVHGKNNLDFTKNVILKELQDSTIKPDKVSLSISGVESIEPFLDYGFEIIVTQNIELKNAAQNRNIAGSALNTDIISFIDSDDVPHKQRNEYILEVFNNFKTSAIVHNYEIGPQVSEEFLYRKYNKNIDKEIFFNAIDDINTGHIWPAPSNRDLWTPCHNAHVSVLLDVFKKIKYNELPSFERIEDSVYTSELVQQGIHISIITTKLSWYRK
jgi:glycosyltransferase involved in cell wall biosynthesis